MKMIEKHKSKLHKGFEKQVKRQDEKEDTIYLDLPVSVKLPKNFKGIYTHSIEVHNNKWNGMNLKNLRNSFIIHRIGGMYGRFQINENGKFILSRYGKELLKRKKLRKQNQEITK